jgi:hypothetical protein
VSKTTRRTPDQSKPTHSGEADAAPAGLQIQTTGKTLADAFRAGSGPIEMKWPIDLAVQVLREGKAIAETDCATPRLGWTPSDGEPTGIHRIQLEIQTLARELEWKLYWLGQQEYVFHHWNEAAETVKTIREHIESTLDKDLATKVAEMPEAGKKLRALKQQRTNALGHATELRRRDADALKERVAKLDHEHPNWPSVQMVQELTSLGAVHMNGKPYTARRIGQIRNELRRAARAQQKFGR